MSTKPEEMQSVVVKSEEMQPEMQLPVSDVKPKRFALKPRKPSPLKPYRQRPSAFEEMMLPDPKQVLRWQDILETNCDFARQPETKSSGEVSSIVK